MKGREHTFLGGLDWTVLAGKEIMGKSSDRVGGGEEVAGVPEAGVPFPPARVKTISSQQKRTFQSVSSNIDNALQYTDSRVEIYCNSVRVDLMCSGSGWKGVRHCGRAPSWATCPWRKGAWPCHTTRRGSTESPSPHRKSWVHSWSSAKKDQTAKMTTDYRSDRAQHQDMDTSHWEIPSLSVFL